jgi:hypothetical protein
MSPDWNQLTRKKSSNSKLNGTILLELAVLSIYFGMQIENLKKKDRKVSC